MTESIHIRRHQILFRHYILPPFRKINRAIKHNPDVRGIEIGFEYVIKAKVPLGGAVS
jgi:hypothetical protein